VERWFGWREVVKVGGLINDFWKAQPVASVTPSKQTVNNQTQTSDHPTSFDS